MNKLKNRIITLSAAICTTANAYALSHEATIAKIDSCITQSDSIIASCYDSNSKPIKRQKDQLIGSLQDKTQRLNAKVGVMADSISGLNAKLQAISDENKKMEEKLQILSDDLDIFRHAPYALDCIPPSLHEHFNCINKVIEVENKITAVENTISKIKSVGSANTDATKDYIRNSIQNDVNSIADTLMSLIDTGMPTFSPAQQQYVKPGLTERYNRFSIYFK